MSWPSSRRLRVVGLAAGTLLALLLVVLVVYSVVALSRFERVEARRATYVYAGAQPLVPGL